jgi:hypothetical protein
LPKKYNPSKIKLVFAILIIVNALVFEVTIHLPLNILLKHHLYFKESWISDNNYIVKKIPPDAYIITTNSLLPQVACREHVFIV